ncbi:MAG: hypothetical protein WBF87_13700 [Mesorhizobium sp.]
MSNDKLRRLVESLHRQTSAGRLDWKEDQLTFSGNSYHLNLSLNTVRISETTGNSGRAISIQLIDENGKIVDNFTDEDIDRSDHKYFGIMVEIYEMAARNALGADKVIDAILNELDDDLPF